MPRAPLLLILLLRSALFSRPRRGRISKRQLASHTASWDRALYARRLRSQRPVSDVRRRRSTYIARRRVSRWPDGKLDLRQARHYRSFQFCTDGSRLLLSPLRAYAHEVPHYYLQNFGQAASHPDSNDFAAFAQDTIRVSNHLAVNLGVRWDLQTFSSAGLVSNPLFPPSGKVPFKPYNFEPRAGLAYSIGRDHPLVVRAGYGLFYVGIPQIYNSAIATANGITNSSLYLNNANYYDPQVFPTYPSPLLACPVMSAACFNDWKLSSIVNIGKRTPGQRERCRRSQSGRQ
jgi:outer membrane receptor protein involved in Fe transport